MIHIKTHNQCDKGEQCHRNGKSFNDEIDEFHVLYGRKKNKKLLLPIWKNI
jgi:hypothetical protein